jgi:hypothetical protein
MSRAHAKASLTRYGVAVLMILTEAPSVFAQSPPAAAASSSVAPQSLGPPSLGNTLSGAAKESYDAGRLLFLDHDYAGALVKFQSAYDRSKEPRLLFNMAACEKNLRHYAKTIADFERYRAEGGASLSRAEHDEVDRYLAELRPFVGAVRVAASETGANVYVDDELVGTTPLSGPLPVDIGSRRIRVSKDGFSDATTTVMVSGAEAMAVDVQLNKIVHAGRLSIRAGERDVVDIDGQPVGIGQFDGALPSGGHQIRVRGNGMATFQSEVLIQDGRTRTVEVTLQSLPHGGLPPWAWITGGAIVAAGAAVGGYFLFKPKDESGAPAAGTISPGTVTLSVAR